MNRVASLLFALVLIVALVIAIDPGARQRAVAFVQRLEPTLQKWDDTIVVNIPSIDVSDSPVTPVPTSTPVPTPLADADDEIIPNTGEDSSDEPIIQINWDALGDSLRNFWESLRNIKIDLNPNDNQ